MAVHYKVQLMFGVEVPDSFNEYVGEEFGIIMYQEDSGVSRKYLFVSESEQRFNLSSLNTIFPYRIPESNTEYYKFQVWDIIRKLGLDINLENVGWLVAGQKVR